MSESETGNVDLQTMVSMGLVVDGGNMTDVQAVSIATPSGDRDMPVSAICVVEDPMGERVEYTVFRPNRQNLSALRAEMEF